MLADPRFVDIDACLSFPCTQTGLGPATCSDLLNPAPNSTLGRNCTCSVAGQDYRSDVLGCQGELGVPLPAVCGWDTNP
jgi:hypothetical protein